MACAEPLFFDCQGTVAYSLLGSQRYSSDFSTQIMFDAERGIVEVPGGGRGLASATNEYWTRQSDWMQVGATSEMRKTVKECTTLRIQRRMIPTPSPVTFALLLLSYNVAAFADEESMNLARFYFLACEGLRWICQNQVTLHRGFWRLSRV